MPVRKHDPAEPDGRGAGLAGVLCVLGIWAVLVVPNLTLRPLYYEEGRYSLVALDMLVNGHWLRPEALGEAYLQKPPLQFWLMAVSAWLHGGAGEWALRMPTAVALLAGALLVYLFARRYVRPAAGLLAVIAFLTTPLMIMKLGRAEPDVLLTVLLFGAFVAWWGRAESDSRVGFRRWLTCLALLGAASLVKGPQPLAFFGLAALGDTLWRRRWGDLPGLVVVLALSAVPVVAWSVAVYEPGDAREWQIQMRFASTFLTDAYLFNRARYLVELLAQLAPWGLLALPAILPPLRERLGIDRRIVTGLALYALVCPLVLTFWPGAYPRYALPMVPAMAVCAALVADRVLGPARRLTYATAATAALVLGAQIVYAAIVVPHFLADRFGAVAKTGREIGRVLAGKPGPAYWIDPVLDYNLVFYANTPIMDARWHRNFPIGNGEAWLIASLPQFAPLRAGYRGYRFEEAARLTMAGAPAPTVVLRVAPSGAKR